MPQKTNKKSIGILINAKSGKGLSSVVDDITQHALQLGWSGPILTIDAIDQVANQIDDLRAQGATRLVIAGGDGTIRLAAQHIHDSGIELAILPLGTGNLLALNLNIPLNLDQALNIALNGQAKSLDCGQMNSQLFMIGAGLGLDAKIMANVTTQSKNKLGVLAYAVSAVRYMSDRSHKFLIAVGDQPAKTYHAKMVLVSNLGKIQAGIQVAPQATPDSRQLKVAIVEANTILEWLSLLGWLLRNQPQRSSSYHSLSANSLTVDVANEPVPYQCDGDNMGTTDHVEVKVLPNTLKMVYGDVL